jgi:peptide chain release factor 2
LTKPGSIFDLAAKSDQIAQLDSETQAPDFWNAQEKAQKHLKRIKQLRMQVEPWLEADKDCRDQEELVEMLKEESDAETEAEVEANTAGLATRLDALELQAMLSEETDPANCYLHIHAGAGGTESCDWAAMLLRMYQRWSEAHGHKIEEIEFTPGDEAGIKSVTVHIQGDYAFGHLKSESGVHRLVRISPFDANSRRHTSFASVFATPEIDDSIEIEIRDDELRIDTYRSSGAGGQHVNKTDSAVRITHEPSGIVVSCQNERSQHKNKATALRVLKARLYQFEVGKRNEEKAKVEGQKAEIGWGSQIRSYVFQPYQMVKDLRTSHETGNIQGVMDGDLDPFMEAFLRYNVGAESNSGS